RAHRAGLVHAAEAFERAGAPLLDCLRIIREKAQLPHDLVGHAVIHGIQSLPVVTVCPRTETLPVAPFVNWDLHDGAGVWWHELRHRAHVRYDRRGRYTEPLDNAVAERVIERRQQLHVRL